MNGENRAEERYREFLNTLSLMSLRVLGRNYGVAKASSLNKDVLVESLINLLTFKAYPTPRSNKGAPAKQTFIDPAIVAELDKIRREEQPAAAPILPVRKGERVLRTGAEDSGFMVASGERKPFLYDQAVFKGILELSESGEGALRTDYFSSNQMKRPIGISAAEVEMLKLREGDCITCTADYDRRGDLFTLGELLSVNGAEAGRYEDRPLFEELTPRYPCEKIRLSEGDCKISLRLIDLFAPVGKGQRALIVAPPRSGKTTLLREIAQAIGDRHGDLYLYLALVDVPPEEESDFCAGVRNAEVFSSKVGTDAPFQIERAEAALNCAKHAAEQGKHAVLLVDSLTKLLRAYRATAGEERALLKAKQFFGTARNTSEAGSLTVLAVLSSEEGSDICAELKETANAAIVLSSELAARRIFPAIDVLQSGTKRDELLSSEAELSAACKLRRTFDADTAKLIEEIGRTKDNAEWIALVSS